MARLAGQQAIGDLSPPSTGINATLTFFMFLFFYIGSGDSQLRSACCAASGYPLSHHPSPPLERTSKVSILLYPIPTKAHSLGTYSLKPSLGDPQQGLLLALTQCW